LEGVVSAFGQGRTETARMRRFRPFAALMEPWLDLKRRLVANAGRLAILRSRSQNARPVSRRLLLT